MDSTTSHEIMKLFDELHKNGNTIVLVTHEATSRLMLIEPFVCMTPGCQRRDTEEISTS